MSTSRFTRRKKSSYQRNKKKFSEQKKVFLIYCNGEKTERFYFEGFRETLRLKTVKIRFINCSPENMAKMISRDIDKSVRKGKKTADTVRDLCCVVDCDNFDLKKAIENAAGKGIDVFYSNVSFEVWLLLHFVYFTRSFNSKQIVKEVSKHFKKHLNKKYRKNDVRIFEVLRSFLENAKKNAAKQLESHGRTPPEDANSSTTVHHLIRRLELIKKDEAALRGY